MSNRVLSAVLAAGTILGVAEATQASQVCSEPAVVAVDLWVNGAKFDPVSDLARYYPDRAARAGQPAEVRLDCVTDAQTDCVVTDAGPPDHGFEAAAISLTRLAGLPKGSASIRAVFRIVSPGGKEIPCE